MMDTKDLEKIVLGEILQLDNQEQQAEVLLHLNEAYFNSEFHRKVFNKLTELCVDNKYYVDQVILAQSFKVKEQVKISELLLNVYSSAYLDAHIANLEFAFNKKQLTEKLNASLLKMKVAYSNRELIQLNQQVLKDCSILSNSSAANFINFIELERQLQTNIYKEKSDIIDGFVWGIRDLDILTNGIQTSRLYVIAGLKKSGKTRFIIHLIRELYNGDVPIAFFSLEVPAYDLYKMLKASFMGIEDTKLRSGTYRYLTKTEKELLVNITFENSRLQIECGGSISIGQILAKIRTCASLGAKVIIIDYLQRINLDIKNKVNELESISIQLANISRELNISVVLLSQLSNAAEGETPTISHVKGSGGIAESADTIIILDNLSRKKKKPAKNKF